MIFILKLTGLPKLTNGQAYNYVLLFSSGNIKIGFTTDICSRIKQLSNSNSGGYKLIDYYISKPNYIARTIESFMHEKFKEYRIEGEFFSNVDFITVCDFMNNIFSSNSFKRCNKIRRDFTKSICNCSAIQY